jgi:hypothetical protein
MRGLYAHASDRMRDDLMAALQARWEDSLRVRAATHSPIPLRDELLAPFRQRIQPMPPRRTQQKPPSPRSAVPEGRLPVGGSRGPPLVRGFQGVAPLG